MSGVILGVTIWGMELLLALSGWRPGMLLNIPQSTGQFPITKNYPAPKIDSAEVEKL